MEQVSGNTSTPLASDSAPPNIKRWSAPPWQGLSLNGMNFIFMVLPVL